MIRQVVIGHRDGKSVVVSDGPPRRSHAFTHAKGMEFAFSWATPEKVQLSAANHAESVTNDTTVIPPPGETRFLFLKIPPDSYATHADYDPAAAFDEMVEHQPDIVATMEPDAPGFHRTDSIDYVVVLDGEIHLELDDDEVVVLKEHDVVIQGGTRHAWRNKSDRHAILAVVLVGAERDVD